MKTIKQQLEEVIKKNLPEKKDVLKEAINGIASAQSCAGWNLCLREINTSLIADEVLKITKCDCCDENDEHIYKDDRSTTRISRPCSGCGKHQTIAGALLKSKEWDKWYKYAAENMLFDVDETLTVDAMSDEHWNSFMKFLNDEVLKVVVEKIEELRKTKTFPQQLIHLDHSVEYFERLSDGDIHYNRALDDLLSNLSPNKE